MHFIRFRPNDIHHISKAKEQPHKNFLRQKVNLLTNRNFFSSKTFVFFNNKETKFFTQHRFNNHPTLPQTFSQRRCMFSSIKRKQSSSLDIGSTTTHITTRPISKGTCPLMQYSLVRCSQPLPLTGDPHQLNLASQELI